MNGHEVQSPEMGWSRPAPQPRVLCLRRALCPPRGPGPQTPEEGRSTHACAEEAGPWETEASGLRPGPPSHCWTRPVVSSLWAGATLNGFLPLQLHSGEGALTDVLVLNSSLRKKRREGRGLGRNRGQWGERRERASCCAMQEEHTPCSLTPRCHCTVTRKPTGKRAAAVPVWNYTLSVASVHHSEAHTGRRPPLEPISLMNIL